MSPAPDVVTVLRDGCVNHTAPFDVCSDAPWGALCPACAGAAEIERLRAERDRWRTIADRFRNSILVHALVDADRLYWQARRG